MAFAFRILAWLAGCSACLSLVLGDACAATAMASVAIVNAARFNWDGKLDVSALEKVAEVTMVQVRPAAILILPLLNANDTLLVLNETARPCWRIVTVLRGSDSLPSSPSPLSSFCRAFWPGCPFPRPPG